jgi:hypothetical protein
MGKYGRLGFNLLLLAITLPLVYYFTESFTAPVGHVSTSGTTYTTGGLFVAEHVLQNGVWVDNPYTLPPTANTIGGINSQTLAGIGAIPWLLPLFILIWTIIDLTRPEKPEGM